MGLLVPAIMRINSAAVARLVLSTVLGRERDYENVSSVPQKLARLFRHV
jgi:hypothetical protein